MAINLEQITTASNKISQLQNQASVLQANGASNNVVNLVKKAIEDEMKGLNLAAAPVTDTFKKNKEVFNPAQFIQENSKKGSNL